MKEVRNQAEQQFSLEERKLMEEDGAMVFPTETQQRELSHTISDPPSLGETDELYSKTNKEIKS